MLSLTNPDSGYLALCVPRFSIAQPAAKVGPRRDRQSTWETARSALACSIRSTLQPGVWNVERSAIAFPRATITHRGYRPTRNRAYPPHGIDGEINARSYLTRDRTYRAVLNDKSAVSMCHGAFSRERARFIRSASLFEEKFTGVPARLSAVMNASCLRARRASKNLRRQ